MKNVPKAFFRDILLFFKLNELSFKTPLLYAALHGVFRKIFKINLVTGMATEYLN